MANFTNTKINKSYQRVVQVDGGVLQDGLGNTLSGSMNDLTVDGRLAITGHSDVSASISRLDDFSASLDATFATDAQLEAVSSSLSTTIDNIQYTDITTFNNYTSSANSILQDHEVQRFLHGERLTSIENFTGSLSNTVNGLNAATSSYAIKTQISGSVNELSSSIATRFDNIVHSDVSALNAATSSYALISQISGSSDILSASLATRVDSLVDTTSSYALLDQENNFTDSQKIQGSLFASSSKLGSHHWGGQMFTTKGQFNDFNLEQNRNSSDGTDFSFFKSRGTPGAEMYAQAGDEVYNLRAYAYKSGSTNQGTGISFSDYEFVAAISTVVEETRPQSASGDIKFTVRDIDRSINTVTIDSSGHISSSNDISASVYYGDGSQLNNLPNSSGELPPSSTYLVPALINGTPGGSTSLTASAGIYKCMYSGANGTHIVELPDASSIANTYRTIRFISDASVSANDVVQLSGSLGQTIDGSATYDIDRNYEGIMVWSDGTNWFRIQSKA